VTDDADPRVLAAAARLAEPFAVLIARLTAEEQDDLVVFFGEARDTLARAATEADLQRVCTTWLGPSGPLCIAHGVTPAGMACLDHVLAVALDIAQEFAMAGTTVH
jgi:hypothetical protein